jgi:hypothetical protein
MVINNAIYGTSEQWFFPSDLYRYLSDDTKKLKFVNFADVGEDLQLGQWVNGVEYGKIIANEMPDKSIAVGLLPVDSAYNSINFYPYYSSTTDVIVEERKEDLIPFYFHFSTGNSNSNPNYSTSSNYEFAPDAVYVGNQSYQNYIVAEMPYKHFIACPIIRAYNGSGQVKQFFSIAEYEAEKEVYNKPVLAGFDMFYQTRDNGNRTNGNRISGKSLKAEMLMTHLDDVINFAYNSNSYTILFGCYANKISWGGYGSSPYHHQTIIGADKFNITMDVNIYNWNVEYNGTPDEFITETKRQMAMFGIPFALDRTTAESGDFDSKNMCIPVTNNGIGTGEYTQGTGNKENPSYSWNEQREDSGVNPINPDTNNYVDDTPTYDLSLGAWRVFNRSYIVDADTLDNLASFLWLGSVENEGGVNVVINALKLMGANPLDAIISLRFYPFNISSQFPLKQTEVNNIIIGNAIADGVTGELIKSITGNNNIVLDLGNAKFPKYFDNFLDYSPYTTAELYIPYCKRINIDVEYFVGKTIDIKLIVDLNTGGCLGCVYSDNVLYYVTEGMIGVEIAVTGANNAQYTKQVLTSALSTSSALATGNVGGIVGGALDLATNAPKVQVKGGSRPTSSLSLPQNAYLFIHSPIPQIPSTYAHTFGNACSIGGTVGNFSGFTVFSNTDLTGISATDNEKMQIESLLNTGVYL